MVWLSYFFFFNDTATTEIYTLSLHDALPISARARPEQWQGSVRHVDLRSSLPAAVRGGGSARAARHGLGYARQPIDRKSTRLNSSHANISYAVFCLKKKNNIRLLRDILKIKT